VDVCENLQGIQLVVPEGYFLVEGECLTDTTLDTSSTPTLTEVVLAATGAERSSGSAALALSLILGGLGMMLLRRQVDAEI
jgi:LPXTG-motif cell wall-anchored protein